MRSFDQQFKRTRSTISIMFWAALVIQVVLAAALGAAAFLAIGEIREHGLKGVVERIWEGPSDEPR